MAPDDERDRTRSPISEMSHASWGTGRNAEPWMDLPDPPEPKLVRWRVATRRRPRRGPHRGRWSPAPAPACSTSRTRRTTKRVTWFAPYVDTTLTPTYAFQAAQDNPARGVALGLRRGRSDGPVRPQLGRLPQPCRRRDGDRPRPARRAAARARRRGDRLLRGAAQPASWRSPAATRTRCSTPTTTVRERYNGGHARLRRRGRRARRRCGQRPAGARRQAPPGPRRLDGGRPLRLADAAGHPGGAAAGRDRASCARRSPPMSTSRA